MPKPFLIIGVARSGTLFLQQVMNKSKRWHVRHETEGDRDNIWVLPSHARIQQVEKRFYQVGYYGEVNWLMLYHINRMRLGHRGIIFRDPVEVSLSLCNLWGLPNQEERLNRLYRFYSCYRQLEFLAETGDYHIISFKRMTTDIEYLTGILHDFGIDDIEITPEMIKTKFNATKINRYNSLADLIQPARTEVLRWRKIIERWLN